MLRLATAFRLLCVHFVQVFQLTKLLYLRYTVFWPTAIGAMLKNQQTDEWKRNEKYTKRSQWMLLFLLPSNYSPPFHCVLPPSQIDSSAIFLMVHTIPFYWVTWDAKLIFIQTQLGSLDFLFLNWITFFTNSILCNSINHKKNKINRNQ